MFAQSKMFPVLLAVVGLTWAATAAEPTGSPLEPLPNTKQIQWDVSYLEDVNLLTVLKRTVHADKIVWLVELKDDHTQLPLNLQLKRFDVVGDGSWVYFYDADGVAITWATVKIQAGSDGFIKRGNRAYAELKLPDRKTLEKVRGVIIK